MDKVGLWEQNCLMAISRQVLWKHSNPYVARFSKLFHDLLVDHVTVVVSCSWFIQPAFYNTRHVYKRLKFRLNVLHFGRTSYSTVDTCRSEATGDLLFRRTTDFVLVDLTTMTPQTIPADTVELLSEYSSTSAPLERIRPHVEPPRVFNTTYQVKWSDTDIHRHLNNSNLVRLCADAMTEAGFSKSFRTLVDDVGSYWITTIQCLYHKEARAGDTLDIHVWEDSSTPMMLHAVVKHGKHRIGQCSIQFNTPLQNKL
jgi:acyl-CoA thioesterase FadM